MKRFKEYSKYAVAFVFCVAVIAVYKTFDSIGVIWEIIKTVVRALTPFGVGFIIAYLLNLPAKKLSNLISKSRKSYISSRSYGLGILATYLVALIIVVITIWALVPALSRNLLDLYNNFPAYVSSATNYLRSIEIVEKLDLLGEGNNKLYELANGVFSQFNMSELGKYAQGVFTMTSGLFNMFIAIISSIYMLLDKNHIVMRIKKISRIIFKEQTAEWLAVHFKRVNEVFTNYIYSRLMCCIIMAVACSIILTVLRVKYAIILGIFVGAMDMIPYFGSIISSVIACLVTLITGGVWKLVWSGISLLVMQQIDGNLLGPKIMGNSLEIRPLWIVIAVTVGGKLFGFLGMLLSVPVAAVAKGIWDDYISELEEKKRVSAVSAGTIEDGVENG